MSPNSGKGHFFKRGSGGRVKKCTYNVLQSRRF